MSLKKYFSIFLFLFAVGGTLPCAAFGAGPALRSAGPVSGIHAPSNFTRGFPLFFGAGGFGVTEVTVQQSQSAPAPQAFNPDKNRVYVPPQWVDGGFGVQISVPGHWTEAQPPR